MLGLEASWCHSCHKILQECLKSCNTDQIKRECHFPREADTAIHDFGKVHCSNRQKPTRKHVSVSLKLFAVT